MFYRFGKGLARGAGDRGGMGFGFRGSSPSWLYVGRGRGGLPHCRYPGAAVFSGRYAGWQQAPVSTGETLEQELGYLKSQAEALKDQLGQIESRMRDLESK